MNSDEKKNHLGRKNDSMPTKIRLYFVAKTFKFNSGRFLELASGGLLYTEMIRTTIEPAMYAKELGNRPKEMTFH
jgi:hypothetical protein